MFTKINRINEQNHVKELVVNLDEIAFLSETEPHVCYDKPTKFVDETDDDTGETVQTPVEWETEPRYLIAFKNGKHPQFISKATYEQLTEMLLK